MQRNTFIFVAGLAVVAALIVGLNIGKSMGNATPVAKNSPTPSPTPQTLITQLSYINEPCGISFTYPSNLQKLDSTTSGTILTNPQKQEDSIIIICQKDIPRVPLSEESMETLIIPSSSGSATLSATIYHDASQKDGTKIDKLIFYNKYKQLDVFIAGFGTVYQNAIRSIKLLP